MKKMVLKNSNQKCFLVNLYMIQNLILKKQILFIYSYLFIFKSILFAQSNQNVRIDTTFFEKEGFFVHTYFNDSSVHVMGFNKDSTKKIEYNSTNSYGYYKSWHKNGNLACEGVSINSINWGIWNFWNAKGQKICIKDYFDNGEKVNAFYYDYYETGVLKTIKKYKGKAKIIEKDSEIPDLFSIRESSEKDLIKTGKWIYFSEYGEVIKIKKYND